jgi:peptidyl-prolyl cis-trans isomerase B (cyclophilin B)
MNTPKRLGRTALLILICLANLPSVVISARTARAAVREFAEMEISGEGIGSGTLRFELWPEVAPRTVANFRYLAESGFYDGIALHRLIPGFMVQGGDPLTRFPLTRFLLTRFADLESIFGSGDPGYVIPDEISGDPRFSHVRGVLSMFNKNGGGVTNTGSSQFLIMFGEAPDLDQRHAAFGRIIPESEEFLSRIENAETIVNPNTGEKSKPVKRIAVNKVRMMREFTAPDKPQIVSATYGGKLENLDWRARRGEFELDKIFFDEPFYFTLGEETRGEFTVPQTLYRCVGTFTATTLRTGMVSGRFSFYGREFPFRATLTRGADGVYQHIGLLRASTKSWIQIQIRLQPSPGEQPGILSVSVLVPSGDGAYLRVAGASETLMNSTEGGSDVSFFGSIQKPYYYLTDSQSNELQRLSPPQLKHGETSFYSIRGLGFYVARTLAQRSSVVFLFMLPNGQIRTSFRPVAKEGDRTIASLFACDIDVNLRQLREALREFPLGSWSRLAYVVKNTIVSGDFVMPFSNSLSNRSTLFQAFGGFVNALGFRSPEFFAFSDCTPLQPWSPSARSRISINFPDRLGELVVADRSAGVQTLPFALKDDLKTATFQKNSDTLLRLDPNLGIFSGLISREFSFVKTGPDGSTAKAKKWVSCPIRGILSRDPSYAGVGQMITPNGTEEVILRLPSKE